MLDDIIHKAEELMKTEEKTIDRPSNAQIPPSSKLTLNSLVLVKVEDEKRLIFDGDTMSWILPENRRVRWDRRKGRAPRQLISVGASGMARKLIEGIARVYMFTKGNVQVGEVAKRAKSLWQDVGGETEANAIVRKFVAKLRDRLHKSGETFARDQKGTESAMDIVHCLLGSAFGSAVYLGPLSDNFEYAVGLCNVWMQAYTKWRDLAQKERRLAIEGTIATYQQDQRLEVDEVELRVEFMAEQKISRRATQRCLTINELI